MSQAVKHLHSIGVYDEWETPQDLLGKILHKIDFVIDLDVCATKNNSKFPHYFTKELDALKRSWKDNFFMNPPYSQIDLWIKKAWNEVQKHKVNGLILTFAKTDTKWFHEFVYDSEKNVWKSEFLPIKSRVKFLKDGTESKNSAPYPSCWIIMRPE
jgi:site-specific DNA-methyltransferase (adenine-specific)